MTLTRTMGLLICQSPFSKFYHSKMVFHQLYWRNIAGRNCSWWTVIPIVQIGRLYKHEINIIWIILHNRIGMPRPKELSSDVITPHPKETSMLNVNLCDVLYLYSICIVFVLYFMIHHESALLVGKRENMEATPAFFVTILCWSWEGFIHVVSDLYCILFCRWVYVLISKFWLLSSVRQNMGWCIQWERPDRKRGYHVICDGKVRQEEGIPHDMWWERSDRKREYHMMCNGKGQTGRRNTTWYVTGKVRQKEGIPRDMWLERSDRKKEYHVICDLKDKTGRWNTMWYVTGKVRQNEGIPCDMWLERSNRKKEYHVICDLKGQTGRRNTTWYVTGKVRQKEWIPCDMWWKGQTGRRNTMWYVIGELRQEAYHFCILVDISFNSLIPLDNASLTLIWYLISC